MGPTSTVLLGIACVLAQGNSPEAQQMKSRLTPEETKVIEQLQTGNLCQQLDQYLATEQESKSKGGAVAFGCASCLKTTMTMAKQPNEEDK